MVRHILGSGHRPGCALFGIDEIRIALAADSLQAKAGLDLRQTDRRSAGVSRNF